MHACQDALLTVFKGHIVAAACSELQMEDPNDDIKEQKFTVIPEAYLGETIPSNRDGVHSYARILCHFASLVSLFVDACREGDGERVIRYWKLCMLHFHAERKTKYALEALRLQFQLTTLQPYLVHQLIWGRFVNTHGGQGRNLSCDLHNEHINHLYKDMICTMGANFTESASTRAARCVSSLERVANGFDRQTGIHLEATAHSRRADEKDVNIVVEVLLKANIMEVVAERYHSKFLDITLNPLERLNRDKMAQWIKKKAKEYTKRKELSPFVEDNEIENEAENLIHQE